MDLTTGLINMVYMGCDDDLKLHPVSTANINAFGASSSTAPLAVFDSPRKLFLLVHCTSQTSTPSLLV